MERYDLMGDTKADNENVGILRTASPTDEKNDCCTDAAITPSNLHNVLGYRKANTAYTGNEIVACPYHAEFMLKCTQAGTTSTGSLDTTSASLGKVYTDGGVKWEVIVLPIELGGIGATTTETARANLELNIKTYTSLSQIGLTNSTVTEELIAEKLPPNSILIVRLGSGTSYPNLIVPVTGMLIVEKSLLADFVFFRLISHTGLGEEINNAVYSNWSQPSFSGWRKSADVDIVPVGTIIAYTGNKIPIGYLDCSGASLNPTTYKNLYSVIGTTYGGDGITSFNLPNLNNGSFLEGSTSVGVIKEAGLPDIEGKITRATLLRNDNDQTMISNGAFSGNKASNGTSARGTNLTVNLLENITFSAKNSNSIYGNADTVQPKSVTVRYCIKY